MSSFYNIIYFCTSTLLVLRVKLFILVCANYKYFFKSFCCLFISICCYFYISYGRPDGYLIPVENPTGIGRKFYLRVSVRVKISTYNIFVDERVIALCDSNPTHCHPYRFYPFSLPPLEYFQQWVISIFLSTTPHQLSFPLSTTSAPAVVCTSLHHPVHSHISISHVSLLRPSQHHHFRLNHFRKKN
jgi:hypothetical protein